MSPNILKIGTSLALFLTFVTSVNGQKTDREEKELKGPVKTITKMVVTYEADGTVSPWRDSGGEYFSFSPNGTLLETRYLDDKKKAFARLPRIFAKESDLAKQEHWYDAKGKFISREVYSYSDGKLTETLVYRGMNTFAMKRTRHYDANGKVDIETYYDKLKRPVSKTIFKYDDKGNWVESAFFLIDGTPDLASMGPCDSAHKVTSVYDSDNRLIERAYFYLNNKRKRTLRWTYDNNSGNHATYSIETDSQMTVHTYKYELDKHGNWTKWISDSRNWLKDKELNPNKEENRSSTVATREITYY